MTATTGSRASPATISSSAAMLRTCCSARRGRDRLYGNEGVNWLEAGSATTNSTAATSGHSAGRQRQRRIYSNGGDDILVGGAGADKLYGTGGTDIIYGDDAEASRCAAGEAHNRGADSAAW